MMRSSLRIALPTVLAVAINLVAFAQDAPKPVKIKIREASMGKRIEGTDPVYPLEARRSGIAGTVELSAVVDKEGRIKKLKVVSGDPILSNAAVNAVRTWRYKPYMLKGAPIEV